MRFYHRTTEAAWQAIQAEGVLWGVPKHCKNYPRYTYLSPPCCAAGESYGPVNLEVEYNPIGIDETRADNYFFAPPEGEVCWQFSVFVPIPLERVKRVDAARQVRCVTGDQHLPCEAWCLLPREGATDAP